MTTTQVQVRLPKDTVDRIDEWIDQGKFTSRSDAVKTILAVYDERELTRKFYSLLEERSKEAREKPSMLIPLDRI
jgi:Arc/MetJ-type ribon-helix-helix transcriptional regulator